MENTTAKVSCFARAYHYINYDTHIFADAFAKEILGDEHNQIVESMIQGLNFFYRNSRGQKKKAWNTV